MNNNEKFEYFIERTDKDLQEIKQDLKRLIGFRMMLLGGSFVISALVSGALLIIFGR